MAWLASFTFVFRLLLAVVLVVKVEMVVYFYRAAASLNSGSISFTDASITASNCFLSNAF